MRFLFRWAFRLFLCATVLLVAGVLLKDTLLKSFAEHRIRSSTGLDARIGRLESGLFSPRLTLENLRLYDSAEYGGSACVSIPELHVQCHASPLALGKVRFKLVRLHIDELHIVESREGQTNLVKLLAGMAHAGSQRQFQFWGGYQFAGIDLLNLTLGKVHYSSLRHPGKRAEIEFGLKNELITNIQSWPQLSDVLAGILLKKGITISTPNGPGGDRKRQ